jgi:hypothetical protein
VFWDMGIPEKLAWMAVLFLSEGALLVIAYSE